MAITVVLADDHQIVREGIRALLAAHPDIQVVAEAADGQGAVDLAGSLKPDVLILDVTMPGLNGIDAMKQIRGVAPETEVLALSMHAADQVVIDMLRSGAAGYLLKGASVVDLARAIRAVMVGQTFLSPEIHDLVPAELLRDDASPSNTRETLTEREQEVLRLVAEGRSSREIAIALFITTKTVVWHRQSIMRKLQLRSIAELTKYAVRMGLTSS
jgi:DNA-binding NarL/FixJ family response regulator